MKDKLIDKIIRFDILLGVVALTISIVAAFFSVHGIATLFSGAFISTIIMASVLEIGKLVSVTYLYRYWKQTKKWICLYLSVALLILMAITSLGIFGYLSSAYQQASNDFKAQQEQIVLVEKTKEYAQEKLFQSQNRIEILNEMRQQQEARLSEALTNTFISRNPIALSQLQDQTTEMIKTTEQEVKTEQEKMNSVLIEIQEIDKKINNMRYSNENKDIRTFEFVAKFFNTTLDNVAKWFIISLIIVFDPLAIALLLCYNVVVNKDSSSKINDSNEIISNDNPPIFKPKSISYSNRTLPKKIVTTNTESIESDQKPSETVSSMDPFVRGYFKQY